MNIIKKISKETLKNINKTKMKTQNIESNQSEYPIIRQVGKVVLGGIVVFSMLYTAQAAFKDLVLDSLESSYASSSVNYDRATKREIEANNDVRMAADLKCNNYRALKAYKESKNIPLKDETINPCVADKAPQEGF